MNAGERVLSAVIQITTDPSRWRAVCFVCPWAAHPSGTTAEGAETAARAHVEAHHGASFVRSIEPRP